MMHTIDDIKAATLTGRCRHWFDDSSMEFFNSVVYGHVFAQDNGSYFVTSEQREDYTPRLFTVRFCSNDGPIETVGNFQEHETFEDAVRAIREDAKFDWRREVPIWAVLRFAEARKSIAGLHMIGWKETAKGGKLTTYDPEVGVVTGQMYK